MMQVALRALVVLGSLAGRAESQAMGGETVGRSPLELVALLVAGVLFYVAFSSVLRVLMFRGWRRKKPLTKHRDVTTIARIVARQTQRSSDAQQARR